MARIALTWAGSSWASLPASFLTMISAGSPGCRRGMRKLSVTTAQRVARKKPNLREKYFIASSCPSWSGASGGAGRARVPAPPCRWMPVASLRRGQPRHDEESVVRRVGVRVLLARPADGVVRAVDDAARRVDERGDRVLRHHCVDELTEVLLLVCFVDRLREVLHRLVGRRVAVALDVGEDVGRSRDLL